MFNVVFVISLFTAKKEIEKKKKKTHVNIM